MRCLWLTLGDPDPPLTGQLLYSGGLIRAVAAQGGEIAVLGLSRPESPRRDGLREGTITWHLGKARPYHRVASLPSPLPSQAYRGSSASMHEQLDRLLQQRWNTVVFDSLSSGWAVAKVLAHLQKETRQPRIVYVSHNHEESVRAALIAHHPRFLRRQMLRFDGRRLVRLERTIIERANLITSITAEDGARYRSQWPLKHIEVLTPGYGGRSLAERRLGREIPRRAVIVGSFDWLPKRMNLIEFVRAADPMFAARRAELQVVGSAEPAFLDAMRRQVVATNFIGRVRSCEQYMDDARIAIVPERHGGGFKLKVLDYVFNRLPIFAIAGSVVGVPLKDGDSMELRSSHDNLARSVLDAMDDFDRLNHLQQSAYLACRDQFDWSRRGQRLAAAMAP